MLSEITLGLPNLGTLVVYIVPGLFCVLGTAALLTFFKSLKHYDTVATQNVTKPRNEEEVVDGCIGAIVGSVIVTIFGFAMGSHMLYKIWDVAFTKIQ